MSDAPLLTRDERIAAGKAQRQACPRRAHDAVGTFVRDPVQVISASSAGRIPALVPLRYGRMLADPFAFYRGTAILQAIDLATAPSTGLVVQVCGDCHLSNFGAYATPERQLVFDINDFDETYPAPFEWDLKRLTASFVVAARHLRFGAGVGAEAVGRAIAGYRDRMRELAGMSELQIWYEQLSLSRWMTEASGEVRARLQRAFAKAQKRSHEQTLPKLAERVDGRWRLRDRLPTVFHLGPDSPMMPPGDESARLVDRKLLTKLLFEDYGATLENHRRALLERHRVEDVAAKVVGVGSVGTRCVVVLLTDADGHPLFLQVKQAIPSVLAGRAPDTARVTHEGRRVVEGQRLMQATSDMFLGWVTGFKKRQFYVRQLRDMKLSAEVETLDEDMLCEYAAVCGMVLARAHAKGSGKAVEIRAYPGRDGGFTTTMVKYSEAYADQVERDFDRFARAGRQGKIAITTEEAFEAGLVA